MMARDSRELLYAKLKDAMRLSEKRPCFLGFLDEGERAACEEYLCRERGARFLFWGGYEEAERVMLGLFPDYLEPDSEEFPMTGLTFSYREEDHLSHRDFLGSFMALGIERAVVGDILVGKGRSVAFLREEMQGYFLENLKKIGRTGVRVMAGAEGPLPVVREFIELSGVIASGRLDCMTAFLCRTSREKAAALIEGGAVMLNHRETISVSERISQGDLLSVRKYGRFIIDQLGPLTSKGRLSVKCRKYQ